jgi:hypothetical protein
MRGKLHHPASVKFQTETLPNCSTCGTSLEGLLLGLTAAIHDVDYLVKMRIDCSRQLIQVPPLLAKCEPPRIQSA